MSLLWRVAKSYGDEDLTIADESHDDHVLHPTFEAAGMRHSPCCYSRCEQQDLDHADAFDEAERRHFAGETTPERLDLTKPIHGFESTADLHTLRAYRLFPDVPHVQRPVKAFRFKGQVHLMDGHHRTAARMFNGEPHVDSDMADLDADNWRP
jgi:hypothetical protein